MKEQQTYLIRSYTAFNLGDDLFLKILFERYPNCQFALFTQNKNYFKFIRTYPNVKIAYFNKLEFTILRILRKFSFQNLHICLYKHFLRRICKKYNGYVSIGGSIFIQNKPEVTLKDFIFRVIVRDIFINRPKFIIGANFGPIKTKEYTLFYKQLFNHFTDICFREKYSSFLFKDLSNVRCAPDIVFQLTLPVTKKEKNSLGFSIIDIDRRTGLSAYSKKYYKLIAALVSLSIRRGQIPYMVSFCENEGDERAINKIISLLDINERVRVKKLLYKGNVDDFLPKYFSLESVFTTRFHAMILGFIGRQNIYPLIYSDKMINVINDLNYTGNYLRIDSPIYPDAETLLNDIHDNKNCYSIDNEKEKSTAQFKILDKYLK